MNHSHVGLIVLQLLKRNSMVFWMKEISMLSNKTLLQKPCQGVKLIPYLKLSRLVLLLYLNRFYRHTLPKAVSTDQLTKVILNYCCWEDFVCKNLRGLPSKTVPKVRLKNGSEGSRDKFRFRAVAKDLDISLISLMVFRSTKIGGRVGLAETRQVCKHLDHL